MAKKEKGYSFVKQQARRDKRRQEAAARQREFDKLTLEQKFAKAQGKKERAKWADRLVKRMEKKPALATAEVKPVKKARVSKSQVVEAAKLANPSKS